MNWKKYHSNHCFNSFSDSELFRLLFHDDLHRWGVPESDIVRFHSSSGSFLQIRIQSARSASRRCLAHLVRLQVGISLINFFCFSKCFLCRFALVEIWREKCFNANFSVFTNDDMQNYCKSFFDKFKSAFFSSLLFKFPFLFFDLSWPFAPAKRMENICDKKPSLLFLFKHLKN